MTITHYIYIVLFMAVLPLSAQESVPTLIEELNFYGDVQLNADKKAHRLRASKVFDAKMKSLLAHQDFHPAALDSLQFVSLQHPADTDVYVLTWKVDEKPAYHGYIIHGDTHQQLHDKVSYLDTDMTYNDKEWYGAIYYKNMVVKDTDNKSHVLLFGYRSDNHREKTKFIDCLSLENGKIVFGAPIFENKDGHMTNRILMSYEPNASTTLNYNPNLDMIIHDHLVRGRTMQGDITSYPDGSYVGYEWDGKKWKYVDKIYDHVSERPPMPKPVLGKSSGTNIFGK